MRKRRQLREDCHGLAFERRASFEITRQCRREKFSALKHPLASRSPGRQCLPLSRSLAPADDLNTVEILYRLSVGCEDGSSRACLAQSGRFA
jgi:hypothetical protein